MKCAYVYSDGDEALVTCNRTAYLRNQGGLPTCSEHTSGTGWVYAMAWGSYVKIGHSVDPLVRLAQLSAGYNSTVMPEDQPGAIALIGAARGTRATEHLLHAVLEDDRYVGEWFHRTERVERLVAFLQSGFNGLYDLPFKVELPAAAPIDF